MEESLESLEESLEENLEARKPGGWKKIQVIQLGYSLKQKRLRIRLRTVRLLTPVKVLRNCGLKQRLKSTKLSAA